MGQTKLKRKQFYDDGWIPANETWAYASADDPTYTFTIASFDATTKYNAGMKIKLTQSTGGTKFAIITKVVFDDPGSTITAYFGTDYNLEDEAITAPYYSLVKAPFGFPLDPTKWTVEVATTSDLEQTEPTASVWYNVGSLSIDIPIGNWRVYYSILTDLQWAGAVTNDIRITLSTANNSESDSKWTCWHYTLSVTRQITTSTKENPIVISTKDTYYLNGFTSTESCYTINFRGDLSPSIIRAVCAYL